MYACFFFFFFATRLIKERESFESSRPDYVVTIFWPMIRPTLSNFVFIRIKKSRHETL